MDGYMPKIFFAAYENVWDAGIGEILYEEEFANKI